MKKYIMLLSVFCLIYLCLAGCANVNASNPGTDGVDVDLTALSSTMVYAEVFNMTGSPDDYIGKTVKMSGPYYASYFEGTGKYYHYVVIEDAAACCQQGLEFKWSGDHSYPEDYPEEREEIEVTGVFNSYEELGQTYYNVDVEEIKRVS